CRAGVTMRTTITRAELLAILQQMATDMAGQKDYLCELDGAMGDGDQGRQDIGTIITKSGLTFNGTAASTIGSPTGRWATRIPAPRRST
ncbi:MAG TPA: hypothetical protein VF579_04815, partial [Candidatus Methylomirabilis sp.]